MREKGRFAAALLLIILGLAVSCRKNKTISQILPPVLPGIDTIPNVPEVPAPVPPASYNQVAVHYSINDNTGGYYEALPPSYDSSDKKFPLLLFLHGGGELGDGNSQLPLILKNAVTKRLYEKTFPVSFTLDGTEYSFIIISPQFKKWPVVEDLHDILEYVIHTYRVDVSRIYLSGLSMGGGVSWEYAGSSYGRSIAAIVPICGASWADSAVARQIAANEVPGWAFHNIGDKAVTVNSTKRYVNIINAQNPVHPIRMTLWPGEDHDAWTKASDPDYREEGKNIYEWMLQYVR